MDEAKKKSVMIGLIIVCFASAGVMFMVTHRGSSRSSTQAGQFTLMCLNEECGNVFELSPVEFAEEMSKSKMPREVAGTKMFTCPKCSQQSGMRAQVCRECETVFIPVPTQDDFQDRCPECGFSAIEDSRK